ncbi:MAG: hypothetical protein H6745_06055 [Deltaproteobacteria bacterium]|nr:hypothetical protein [Deltaproteobacteria bacterium]
MRRLDPPPSKEEAFAQMRAWYESRQGLTLMLGGMPCGSTLEDALALHRRLLQSGRQPSRCMQPEEGP